jgi:hypothetical protein
VTSILVYLPFVRLTSISPNAWRPAKLSHNLSLVPRQSVKQRQGVQAKIASFQLSCRKFVVISHFVRSGTRNAFLAMLLTARF